MGPQKAIESHPLVLEGLHGQAGLQAGGQARQRDLELLRTAHRVEQLGPPVDRGPGLGHIVSDRLDPARRVLEPMRVDIGGHQGEVRSALMERLQGPPPAPHADLHDPGARHQGGCHRGR